MTVAELLTASRASHGVYRQLAAKGKKPDGWQMHLWDALMLRRGAHKADPQHLDSAWSEDKAPHADLMVFYERQLGLQSAGGVDDGRPR